MLDLVLFFFDITTVTSTDTKTVSVITTKTSSTTAVITLTGAPLPPILSLITSPGVESVGGVSSLEVEGSGTV